MPVGGDASPHDVGVVGGAGAGEADVAGVEEIYNRAPEPVPALLFKVLICLILLFLWLGSALLRRYKLESI